MTREEAVRYFKRHIDLYCVEGICREAEEMAIKALEQELEELPSVTQKSETVTEFADRCRECGAKYGKLLKQEPCEDAISRQAAIDAIESWLSCDDYNDTERHIMRAMQSVLYDLPPVTLQPKTGRWEDIKSLWGGKWEMIDNYKCSVCGELEVSGNDYKYCPNCGAKMQEVEE